ncbi:MAG: lyase family protein, partial [Patescibacteria group bacterium]
IIANRANEIMGGGKGTYEHVHPNNHVNMGQSSNDVIPTAIRLTTLTLLDRLYPELEKLITAFKKIAMYGKGVIKVGRSHLQDAVPMTVEQEFGAFAHTLQKTLDQIKKLSEVLLEVGVGGTAIGTGITTSPRFKPQFVRLLADISGYPLRQATDTVELTSNVNAFSLVSAGLRQLAIDYTKIANDLKLLAMGPIAGIGEITLPEVEPGSSIMPGKVNPSIPESVHMAAYQVFGNDHAIALAAQAGQLQLNVMTPLILFNLAFSLQLLTNTTIMFRTFCVDGIIINNERITQLFEESLCTATALSPYLGYHETAALVQEALKKRKTIKSIVLEKSLLTEAELNKIMDPERTTKPALLDQSILKKLKNKK